VVVTGHSTPPVYLGRSPEQLARTIACFRPDLVVLDTCYGFSAPLLDALSAEGIAPLVVGSTHKLPPAGLAYEAPFYASDGAAEAWAAAVRARSGSPLAVWRLDPAALRAAEERVAGWDAAALTARLRRLHPNLVEVDVGGGGPEFLALVPPQRFLGVADAVSARPAATLMSPTPR
jgi:hypothetical protein